MFFGVWSWREGQPRWESFKKRYEEFHPDDIVVLGQNHHAEVHVLYDVIISNHMVAAGRSLTNYSWAQAEHLMDCLEAAFNAWVVEETPGFQAKRLSAMRRSYPTSKNRRAPSKTTKKQYNKLRERLFKKFNAFCIVQNVPEWEED
jgi:hypothetical protein